MAQQDQHMDMDIDMDSMESDDTIENRHALKPAFVDDSARAHNNRAHRSQAIKKNRSKRAPGMAM
jgi:hypothetical protein